MFKKDLALNIFHWFICHKTKPNPTKPKSLLYIPEDDDDDSLEVMKHAGVDLGK